MAKKKAPKRKTTTKTIANYSIRAGAGCGKTTTLEWAEEPKNMPKKIEPSQQQDAIFSSLKDRPRGNSRFACFNNSIQEEAAPRFPNTDVRTNHKLGYHACLKYLNIKAGYKFIDGKKYEYIARDIIGNPWDDPKLWPIVSTAVKLADMARITLTGEVNCDVPYLDGEDCEENVTWEVTDNELINMARFYGMDIEDGESLKYVQQIINEGILNCRSKFDFADMVFLPNVFGCRPDKVARCYVDEAQDLNAAQRGLLSGTAEQFVIVGDVFQSIYGFAGADPDSIPLFEADLKSKQLPLTVTRRCPHSHVDMASKYLPDSFGFAAASGAPEGNILNIPFDVEYYSSLQGTENLIMSRTNAPMVRACFMCWRNNIPALIRGRSIAGQLSATIKRYAKKYETNIEIIAAITDDFQDKIGKLKEAGKDDLAMAKVDELEILTLFLTETKTPTDCSKQLFAMFEDAKKLEGGIQFSTVHKAKGLEADNIGVLTPNLMPHPGISKLGPFWQRQEQNIHYVCHTRGKQNMFINTEDPTLE